jgi:hypothetical protein
MSCVRLRWPPAARATLRRRRQPDENLPAHRPELAAALPHTGHRSPKFFIRDVQVPLRLLDVGMTEHQLDRADIDAVGQKPAGAFVTKIVPDRFA